MYQGTYFRCVAFLSFIYQVSSPILQKHTRMSTQVKQNQFIDHCHTRPFYLTDYK